MVVTRAFRAWLRTLGPARPTPRTPHRAPASASLRALTTAALALPGLAASFAPILGSTLAPSTAAAGAKDEIRIQYGRYEEDDRRLPGVESRFEPIDVDYLSLGSTVGILDRWNLSLDFFQDTWSGATPVASAPQSLFANRASAPDGVSGATPFIAGDLFFDGDFQVLESDLFGGLTGRRDPGLVHTLSSASPETRKEVDLGLEYEWDDAAIFGSGGASVEPDYLSGFARLAGRLDFDQKRTSVDLAASVSQNAIDAPLDHDAVPYIDVSAYDGEIHNRASGSPVLRDSRTDWTLMAGLNRIVSASTRIESALQFRRSTGYLANPYKVVEVAFIDPDQQFLAPPGGYYGDVHALLERRPDERNQLTWSTQLFQDVAAVDAAVRLRYSLAHDDWGIDAHTLEAEWRQEIGSTWLVTPRVRYTTQGAADFYSPLLISRQAFLAIETDPGGNVVSTTPFDHALLPDDYSGDHRLSAFGVLSGGIAVQKRLLRAFVLELGFEYTRYAGDLRLGGGGEDDFTRYDAWLVNAGLRVDLSTLALVRDAGREFVLADGDAGGTGSDPAAEADGGHAAHAAGHASLGAPAGVMYAHALPRAGEFMLGYRTMYMRRSGNIESGSDEPSDGAIVDGACGGVPCSAAPDSMAHQMHMLDLMYAPTPWLSLMLMPSYVDSDMQLRSLDGGAPDVHGNHDQHATGGFGDTRFGPIANIFHRPHHHANLALLVSAPSGDTSVRFRRSHQTERGFVHYDMQLGSGTWDFLPSLTYLGERGRFDFGAQASGIVRMEGEGRTGYALGDELQLTTWAGLDVSDWLAATLRVLYTEQGRIHGRYDKLASQGNPADYPDNAGGRLFDLGIGLSVTVPRGSFAGMQLSLEWIQPLAEDWNGYQLERMGSLAASCGMSF